MEAAGALRAAAPIQESIPNPLGVRVGPGLGVIVIRSPFQTKFQFCRVPCMGGIKLQLLCGVRIELAVGSLPYPGMIWIPGSVLDETAIIWIPNL